MSISLGAGQCSGRGWNRGASGQNVAGRGVGAVRRGVRAGRRRRTSNSCARLDEVGRFIAEAFKHGKAIGMTGEAAQLMPADAGAAGVVTGDASSLGTFVEQFTQAIGQHRFVEREGARGGIGASRRRLR